MIARYAIEDLLAEAASCLYEQPDPGREGVPEPERALPGAGPGPRSR